MKLTLRATLTSILISLLLITVAALGLNSHFNARFTAEDLSTQILDQTSRLVDVQINDLLHTANEQGRTNLRLVQSGRFDIHQFPDLARYWLEIMRVHPRLTRLSLALEATGEWLVVHNSEGDLAIGELRRDDQTGKMRMSEYRSKDYPQRAYHVEPDRTDRDPRRRPWYVAARAAGRQVWSETYILFGSHGEETVPGITCATPILAADGSLIGVLGATFDVIELSTFLRDLKVGEHGFAFVVEVRDDGTRRVVAHQDPTILVKPIVGRGQAFDLVPPEKLSDGRVPAFLDQVPKSLVPSYLKESTRLRFVHDGVRYLGAYSCLSSPETPDWLICIVLPEKDVFGRVERSNRINQMIGLGVLVVAILISLYVTTQVARPLERVARETEAIGRFEVVARPVPRSIVKEVDRLAVAVEDTKTSLRSFQKYVPADLVRLVLSTGQEATLGGERRRVTVSFCDLANFTTLAESISPEELVRHLGDYFGPLSADILNTGGTVDKYIGDSIMAFWGAPAPTTNHATSACVSALRNQKSLKSLRRVWAAEGKPELFARIGIHTGEVIVGNIGCEARLNYTVVGDAANMASRLEGLGKHYGASILIGESTYREARSAVIARPVDWVSVKGKSEGMLVYELLGLKGEDGSSFEELTLLSEQALDFYRQQDWEDALDLFDEIERLRPDDGPARVLAARCRNFLEAPPAENWDGVHRMVSK